MTYLRAWLFLVYYSFRRQLRSRKMPLTALILCLILAVVIVHGVHSSWNAKDFGEWIVLNLLGLFFIPIVALVFGTGALGDARDDKTLVYLLTRPLARWSLFTGKLLGVLPLAFLFIAGGFWLLCEAAGALGEPGLAGTFNLYLPGVLLGSLAYLTLFHLLSALFRHSSLIAIAYVFFVEVFLGRIPGVMKRVSINFYTWCMFYDSARSTGIEPPPQAIFLPVGGETAGMVLAGMAAGFLIAGALVFSHKEYHDVG